MYITLIFFKTIPRKFSPSLQVSILKVEKLRLYLSLFLFMISKLFNEEAKIHEISVTLIERYSLQTSHEPVSLAKAKREGLKMVKFPLARHLQWGSSSGKNLTLNQCLNILLDLRRTGSWETALNNVPRRKLAGARNHMLQKKIDKWNKFSQQNDDDDIKTQPAQEIRPKINARYNAGRILQPQINHRNSNTRTGYNRNSDMGDIPDFSAQARAKFRSSKN